MTQPSETKVKRMSNAPVEKWPLQMVRGQVAMLLNAITGIGILDCMTTSMEYTHEDAKSFVLANMDLIEEKAT